MKYFSEIAFLTIEKCLKMGILSLKMKRNAKNKADLAKSLKTVKDNEVRECVFRKMITKLLNVRLFSSGASYKKAGLGWPPQQDSRRTKCAVSEIWYCGRILL
jgi:hypothetical protein